MTDVDERITELIDELDSEAHERVKQRAASAPKKQEPVVSEPGPDDVVTSALREVEESVNAVKRARGEEPVKIVDAARGIDKPLSAELERLVAQVGPVAAVATLGVRLRQSGRGDEALEVLEAAAESDDAMAAETMALDLEERGEIEKALEWHRFAAEKGDHLARYNLGRMMYERGEAEAASEWLRSSDDPRADDLLRVIESQGG